jgi:hypothetical protein
VAPWLYPLTLLPPVMWFTWGGGHTLLTHIASRKRSTKCRLGCYSPSHMFLLVKYVNGCSCSPDYGKKKKGVVFLKSEGCKSCAKFAVLLKFYGCFICWGGPAGAALPVSVITMEPHHQELRLFLLSTAVSPHSGVVMLLALRQVTFWIRVDQRSNRTYDVALKKPNIFWFMVWFICAASNAPSEEEFTGVSHVRTPRRNAT